MSVRTKVERVRDESRRRAHAHWKKAIQLPSSDPERWHLMELAYFLLLYALNNSDTAIRAADIDPASYRRKNVGPQARTKLKLEFLEEVGKTSDATGRQDFAREAWGDGTGRVSELFKSYGALYRFLGTWIIFDGIPIREKYSVPSEEKIA